MRDFGRYMIQQIEQLIVNYRSKSIVHTDDFGALLRAREDKARLASDLDLERSLDLLKQTARAGAFASYADLAAASGLTWNHTLRARMSGSGGHLDRLLELCDHRKLPLLTALCVNKQNIKTGILESFALTGFIAGVKRLSYHVADEQAFLTQCQTDCFSWGREQRPM